TDDADRRAPPRADSDAARQLGASRIARVARVEEKRRAVVADDPDLELGARDEQIAAADASAVFVLRTERLVRVAAHAAVAAGIEALRRRQPREVGGGDRAVLASEQHANPLAERAHEIAVRVQPAGRRARRAGVTAAAQIHRP